MNDPEENGKMMNLEIENDLFKNEEKSGVFSHYFQI